jgi:DNA-binding MarR family transcriptional regulator
MDKTKIRTTLEVLEAVDATVGNMKINRLQVLLTLAAAGGELSHSELIQRAGVATAHGSKLIASWCALNHLKEKGPGFVESEPDPMNLATKIVRLTPKGRKYLEQIAGD